MEVQPIDLCDKYEPEGDQCGFFIEGGFCRYPEKFRCVVHDYYFLGKISNSEGNTWMKCHKKYQYEYIDGIEVMPKMLPKNMKIGSLVHKGIELLYKGEKPDVDFSPYFDPGEEKEIGIVRILLEFLTPFHRIEPNVPECRFELNLSDIPQIRGVMDVRYSDHFDEYKVSGNPDFYTTPHFLQSQLATYFMHDPDLAYAVMKVIRVPQLKSTGQHKEEQTQKFLDRLKEDIHRRPAHYFIGYDDKDGVKDFGKRFYRSEFNLEEVAMRYRHIMYERRLAIRRKTFFKNETQCLYPQPCPYLQICETGGVSDLIYQRKEVKQSA